MVLILYHAFGYVKASLLIHILCVCLVFMLHIGLNCMCLVSHCGYLNIHVMFYVEL